MLTTADQCGQNTGDSNCQLGTLDDMKYVSNYLSVLMNEHCHLLGCKHTAKLQITLARLNIGFFKKRWD